MLSKMPCTGTVWRIFRFVLILLVIGGMSLSLGGIRAAKAHANLVNSDPVHGSELPISPTALIFEFSEVLDPELAQVDVYDADNLRLRSGPGEIPADNPRLLRFPIDPALPDGTYSAVWTVRSSVDGHITSGLITFSVGANGQRPALLPPVGAADPTTDLPPLPEVVLRWLVYVLALITVGTPTFILTVWRPVLARVQVSQPERDVASVHADLADGLRRIGLASAMGLAVVLAVLILYLAREATPDAPITRWLSEIVYLTQGVVGGSLLVAAGLALVLWRLSEQWRWPTAAGLGLILLFSFSLRGHGAAIGSWTAVGVDLLHLVAVSAWIGGLLPLALAIQKARYHNTPRLSTLIRCFSLVAVVSVVITAASGIYGSLVHIQTLNALRRTTYGQAVILKAALFMGLMAIGAVNLIVLSPRLHQRPERAGRWLERTIWIELALGGLVLIAAGALLATPPGFEALEAQGRQGFVQTVREDGVRMTLRAAPAQPGDNEFGVEVADRRPGAALVEPTVVLRLTPPDGGPETQTEVSTEPGNDGRYRARGGYFSTQGEWQVEVILRRRGFDDVRHTYVVAVRPPSVGPENPIEVSAESLAIGSELYAANCLPCHGATGKGDGPVGVTLDPRPADLTQHTIPGLHSDGQLWLWITNGYPGSTRMPAFGEVLSDEDRWHLVNYIRTLGQDS